MVDAKAVDNLERLFNVCARDLMVEDETEALLVCSYPDAAVIAVALESNRIEVRVGDPHINHVRLDRAHVHVEHRVI
jgi:hypothetical protein